MSSIPPTEHPRRRAALLAGALALLAVSGADAQQGFRFRSGVELINVTATVTDRNGRFYGGLRQDDFTVYDDGEPVEITHFSAERVPVSLGIVLDTSGSMSGDKMEAARGAIDRFLEQLLNPDDEVFLYRFGSNVELVQDWTRDRRAVYDRLGRIHAGGGTAMYDAVAEAVQMAQGGRNQKKAIVVISDGNDTNSVIQADEVRQIVRQTEVLVYAVGIDGQGDTVITRTPRRTPPVARPPRPTPFPLPGGRGLPGLPPSTPPPGYPPVTSGGSAGDRVNVLALRDITDDSGGRTEIVRSMRDLDPATAGIASELTQQYYLGYPSPGHDDGRWHTIRVEVNNPSLRVRARRGYTATKSF
ncbi:MAG: VWA domain-containing protein [Vicinamibacterales bacterium]